MRRPTLVKVLEDRIGEQVTFSALLSFALLMSRVRSENEEHVVRDQPTGSPDLGGEEVSGGDHVGVRT